MAAKFKNIKWNEHIPIILSFVIPVFVMLIIFVTREIYPFGDNCFLRTDLYHQYAPFFNEFADKLQNGESLFYSWDIGGGTNFLSLYSYYLASPLNWLLILIPHEYVIEFISIWVVLKMGLCGLTFALYLKYHNRTCDYGITMFSIFYALSGYLAAYSWNIMWLDCLWLFPLIMLGLERLVKENKCFLYCIALGLSIFSNYYISIMICMFMVLYFVALLFIIPSTEQVTASIDGETISKKRFTHYHKKIFNFALYSALAGGLAAITLIPEIYALQLTASSDTTFPKTVTCYFSLIEMLARHMMTVDVHIKLEHWPNIYCGVAVFLFIPFYIMNKRINYKEKFANFLLVFFMLISFNLNVLNYIWHGFHYPNSLPCRQSFIYIFLILMMCYQGFMGLKERSTKQIVSAGVFGVAFCVIAEKMIESEEFHYYSFYLSILFVALYALVAFMYRKRKVIVPVLTIAGLTLASVEAAVNMTVTSVTTVSRSTYTQYDEACEELIALAGEENEANAFYRFEKRKLRTKNDGAWLDYPSASTFSSMSYDSVADFYRTMGMESSTNAYGSNGITPVMEALLGIKYVFYMEETAMSEGGTYRLAGQSGDVYMYENVNALGLGYMLPADIQEEMITGAYPIDNQSELIEESTGVYDLYELLPMTTSGSTAYATIAEAGYYFTYVVSSSVKNLSASHGTFSKDYENLNRRYLVNLGYCTEGERLSLSTSDDVSTLSVMTYRLNEEVLAEACTVLAEHQLQLEVFEDTYIKGTVDAGEEGGLLFTSIAYDPGWTLYVDGVQTEYDSFQETYICLNLSAGTHSIELRYEPQGYYYGLILSILSLVLLVLFSLLARLKNGEQTVTLVEGPADSGLSRLFYDVFSPESEYNRELAPEGDERSVSDETSTSSGDVPEENDVSVSDSVSETDEASVPDDPVLDNEESVSAASAPDTDDFFEDVTEEILVEEAPAEAEVTEETDVLSEASDTAETTASEQSTTEETQNDTQA